MELKNEGKLTTSSSLSNKIIAIINRGWIIPAYRVIYSAILILLGAYVGISGFTLLAAISFIFFLLIFGLIEYLLDKSIDQIKEETRQQTIDSLRSTFKKYDDLQSELEFKLSLFSKTSNFLSSQLQRTIRTLNHLLSAASSGRLPQAEWVLKRERVNENTLEKMCSTFASISSKKFNIPEADVMFRSTYMIVEKNQDSEEILTYSAWHTPGGHQPRSMSLNKYFKKGEGVAGIAWQRERVVIEDMFKNYNEWLDNYPGQGELYSSMACIPVFNCTINSRDTVIGVITIDTNLKDFFGCKNDKIMEDKISNWVRPYADYISFTTVMTEIVKDFTEQNSE